MTTSSNQPHLSSLPAWMAKAETIEIMAALNSAGGEARFVGGCVRDTLLNRQTFDIDIAVNYPPDETLRLLKAHNIKAIPTGIEHGTVTAVAGDHPFEITSLRRDVKTYGRHADVEYTTEWEEDSCRRDFTVNAIYADMEGRLYDYHDGIEDIRFGRIVFVGDAQKRVQEDYLRILRFFRFFAMFGKGEADSLALSACRDNVAGLKDISLERVTKEILKTLEGKRLVDAWTMMIATGVIAQVIPQATDIEALTALVELEEKFDNKASPLRRLAALCGNVEAVDCGLRLSNAQKDELRQLAYGVTELGGLIDEQAVQRLVYKFGNNAARSLLLLHAALGNIEPQVLGKAYDIATSFKAPLLPIKGDDVLEAGISQGKEVGEIFRKVEQWWAEKNFAPKRAECLEKIRELVGK